MSEPTGRGALDRPAPGVDLGPVSADDDTPKEACGVFEAALAPDPAVPLQRQAEAEHGGTGDEQRGTQPHRRLHHAVQREHKHVGQHDTEGRGQQALGELDDPDAPAEIRELRFKNDRQRCFHNRWMVS